MGLSSFETLVAVAVYRLLDACSVMSLLTSGAFRMRSSSVRIIAARATSNRRQRPSGGTSLAAVCGLMRSSAISWSATKRYPRPGYMVKTPLIDAERANQRACAIGVGKREVAVPGQVLDQLQHVVAVRKRLRRKPFVEHQRIVAGICCKRCRARRSAGPSSN